MSVSRILVRGSKVIAFIAAVFLMTISVDFTKTVSAADQKEIVSSGTVLETFDGGGYTYMQVDTALGKEWVAIPQNEVKVGGKVSYYQGMTMNDFYSKTFDRTFESIIFSSGLAGAEATPKVPSSQKKSSFADAIENEAAKSDQGPVLEENPKGSSGAIVPKQPIKIEKAEGGYTVGEIFGKAKELDKKRVLVRGQVVKVNMNIMGKNWVHIQDGTGQPMKNTHDLVVTTTEEIAEKSVVLFEGLVSAEKDFGAGYSYAVILEEAVTTKK